MPKRQLIGVDLGFGFTKGFDGRYAVILPSLLSERGLPQKVPGDGRLPRNGGRQMMVDDGVVYVGRGADGDWRSPLIPRQPDRLFGDD